MASKVHWWQVLIGVLLLALAVLTYVGAVRKSNERSDALVRQVQLQSCIRGNVVRAYLRADSSANAKAPTERRERADTLFPILDCSILVDTGHPVALPLAEQRAYIERVVPALGP